MKITAVTQQVRDKERVNVFVDGAYRLSLLISQYADTGLRVGDEISEEALASLEDESVFGKVYTRTLEYALSRPRSVKEVSTYLQRKTRDTRTKTGGVKKGISQQVVDRVLERLQGRGYVNDEVFTQWWIENRNARKGSSLRKLQAELRLKGVDVGLVERLMAAGPRSDKEEIEKVIAKKRARYDDQKLMQYLARQGFRYDDIREALGV